MIPAIGGETFGIALSVLGNRVGKTNDIATSCSYDFGKRCILKVHVLKGRIIRIKIDDGEYLKTGEKLTKRRTKV
ncbi:hypothetical protein ACFLYR_08265 [Chloroflexota bacterium]